MIAMIRDIATNKNKNNINGIFAIGAKMFFYKIIPLNLFFHEVRGYNFLKKYYPVANLIFRDQINNKTGLLLYEFDESIGKNRGLMGDILYGKIKEKEKKDIDKIFLLYQKVFLQTLKFKKSDTVRIFFHDRIYTRLNVYYSKNYVRSFQGKEIVFNDTRIKLDPLSTFKSVKNNFKQNKKTWCVACQCDPSELNIGLKPVIFDYLAGGFNPLMAEFATFIWYTLTQGDYLSLKHNSVSFNNHEKIFSSMAKVKSRNNTIEHSISKTRKDLISKYIKTVIIPVLKKMKCYNEWYKDFKNFFVLRLFGVFDVSKMAKKDQLLSFSYLEFFYNKINPQSPKDFIKVIYEL